MNLREHHKLQSASDGSVGLMLDSHKHEGLSGHHQPHLKKKQQKPHKSKHGCTVLGGIKAVGSLLRRERNGDNLPVRCVPFTHKMPKEVTLEPEGTCWLHHSRGIT